MFSYIQLRRDYPEFIYHGYQIKEEKERICLEYDFEIPGLSSFHPTWEFPKKDEENRKYADDSTFRKLAFSLGMVELISYWKTACPPKVIVEAGDLTAEQILWWRICILTDWENFTIQMESVRIRKILWKLFLQGRKSAPTLYLTAGWKDALCLSEEERILP